MQYSQESPIQELTRPDPVKLLKSDEISLVQASYGCRQ